MAQTFTCSDLEYVRIASADMWGDPKFQREVKPEVSVVSALAEMQTAKISFFEAADKIKRAKVYWVEGCTNTVVDCANSCTPAGEEVSSNCKDYAISECKEAKLKIVDTDFYTDHIKFLDAVAKAQLNKLTSLDNQIEQDVIAALASFASANQYTGDDRGDVVGTDTFISGSYWNSSLMSYFAKVMKRNYMENAKMFSGENMFDAVWLAGKNSANADGKGNQAMFESMPWHFDITNFDTILGAKTTLMVSPDAAAFVSTHKFLKQEEFGNGANLIRYSVPSPNIPGVIYDVIYQTECVNGGDDIRHFWKYIARYDTFGTPVVCSGSSGVLSFTCGEAA